MMTAGLGAALKMETAGAGWRTEDENLRRH